MKNYSLLLGSALLCMAMGAGCTKNNSSEQAAPEARKKPRAVNTAFADSTIEVAETPSGPQEAARLAQNNPASDFTPTGFYMPPGATLKVQVEQLAGTSMPKLLIGTYSRYKAKWNPTEVVLKAGENIITDATGGLMYLRYATGATTPGKVKVKFLSGQQPVPFYVQGKTTHTDWLTALDSLATAPDVQLVSARTIMVASRANALAYKNENQDEVLRIADRVINIEDSISGLDGSTAADKVNVHKYLMTETDNSDYYMVATWYRTAYYQNTLAAILTVSGLGTNGWGPWHELGHMHQQGAWTWGGLGEVTVNIYSLAVERKFGITPSRLKRDNVWPKLDTYFALADAERDFNSTKADVWMRLAMFHQLWMAFGDGFYHQLHKQTRAERPSLSTDALKMRYFMLKACNISGKNLASFFRKWGFKVDESVYTEIAALNLPAPATDPSTLRE